MIRLKSLITEVVSKKVKINVKGTPVTFSFTMSDNSIRGLIASSKDLDIVDDLYDSEKVEGQTELGDIVSKELSKKLGLPVSYDWSYVGGGFKFNVNVESLLDKLK